MMLPPEGGLRLYNLHVMAIQSVSVKKILEKSPFGASAPCRIDAGGTWDIKAMALPFERIQPVTVNIALNLRTRIELLPYRDNWVKISSDGFRKSHKCRADLLDFTSPFGIFYATVAYFGMHGLEVRIKSGSPVKSALGGSSTALVALIKSLSDLSVKLGNEGLTPEDMLHLGYHLEDGINGGNCGIQDQAAAVYAGINLWKWRFGIKDLMMHREILIRKKEINEFSERLLVAFSGISHVALDVNRLWIRSFLKGETRNGWIEANEMVKAMALALKKKDWVKAVDLLKEEMSIRRKITPDALIPITEKLINQAQETGCGARFAGAGAGGCVWALGESPEAIHHLRNVWHETLSAARDAMILQCSVDTKGVE